jgi:1-piperideine-2-carboxylate/1-pyrroline-2-carboxylate reductase [NAD(P)H]
VSAHTDSSLSAEQTAQALPYAALADAIEAVLRDPAVRVPPRMIEPLHNGGSLFVMPAYDRLIAITKLITFMADNPAQGRPTIQGDIVVMDAQRGHRMMILDGPTVTARRTAAVSLVAAQHLAPRTKGPLLIVGAGVQGRSHLEAFHAGLGVSEVWVASRSQRSADALVTYARSLGLKALRTDDPNRAMAECPLIVSTTSAQAVALTATPSPGSFVSAVGAFKPSMVEWSAQVCQDIARDGSTWVDTRDADHEAGDFIQAGLNVSTMPTLADAVRHGAEWVRARALTGSVMFNNCGWAGWDLAAARCAAKSAN